MNTQNGKSLIVLAIVSALGLSACNVDLNVDGKPVANVEVTRTGVVANVNSKGLEINGVTYDTSNATIMVNGVQGDTSDLKQGMLVAVSGTDSSDGSAKATLVRYDNDVTGVVSGINLDANASGTLTVLGQTVRVDKDTAFESDDVTDQNIRDIDDGNIVEVSGYASGDGEIWATRIEVKDTKYDDGDSIELKGNISNLNTTTFNIGDQLISIENAILDTDFAGVLQNGQYVEVKSTDGFNAEGVLLASEIELQGNGSKKVESTENDEQVEIKGIVTREVNANQLQVNGSVVLLDQGIQLSTASMNQLKQGALVEVEGYINADGVLVATKLKIESESNETGEGNSGSNDSSGKNSESTESGNENREQSESESKDD